MNAIVFLSRYIHIPNLNSIPTCLHYAPQHSMHGFPTGKNQLLMDAYLSSEQEK